MNTRIAALNIALCLLVGCSAIGVQEETTRLARGVTSLDASIRLTYDLLDETEARLFVRTLTTESAKRPLAVDFEDEACTDIGDRASSARDCTMRLTSRPPIPGESVERDQVDADRFASRHHAQIASATLALQNLSLAGSVSGVTTAIRNASFMVRGAIASNTEASVREVEDLPSDASTDVVREATDERDRVSGMVAATNAGIEFGEGLFADYFEYRLAKLRRKRVIEGVEHLVEGKCKQIGKKSRPCGSPTADASRHIAKKSDAMLLLLHGDLTELMEADHGRLECATQRASVSGDIPAVGANLCEDFAVIGKLMPKEARAALPEMYQRLHASRAIVVHLDRIWADPQPPISQCGSNDAITRSYLLSALVEQYDQVFRQLKTLAISPKTSHASPHCFFEFEAQSTRVLETLTRVRQLMRTRFAMDVDLYLDQ